MSEPINAPAPPPAEQPKLLNNYRIVLVNGLLAGNIASPHDFPTFCRVAQGDGYIASDKMFIRFAAIATIEAIGPFDPQQNVVQGAFGLVPGPAR